MQTIKLNLIPGSVLPVVNVSQYDVKRQFALEVYEGAVSYSLSGKSVEIRGTKPDGNGFAYDAQDGVVSVSGNTVTISTTQQMTAVGGQTMAELRITSGDTILGTLNFVLMVEPSALSDDTPISDTDIPAIERDFEAALAEAEADALKAEGYAVGTQDGTPAQSGEPYYQDNAKYYKEQAEAAASGGGADALKAEGYAVGTQNCVPVTSGSPYYHNNAAYYAGEASTSATNAATSETNAGLSETAAGNSATSAAADALVSEGWAVGKQNGTPVTSGSPYYQNNAEYYKDQAAQYAAGGLIFQGSVAFANIPTAGMVNGDMYNITDDFTTDSRFIEGAGVSVKAGADIAWVAGSVNKWDILALGGGGGANALDDLTDVNITNPTPGQVLKFTGSEWVNGDGGGGGITIVQIPSVVVGTYTYNGSAQGPTITGLDSTHTVVTGATATNVGNYTLTIALADPQTMVWSDLTTADKTYSWSIGKAPGAVTLSKNTVVLSNSVPSDTVTISNATGPISITSGDTSVATVSPSTMSASGGTLTVTGAGAGTATVTVSVAASSNYNATSETISVTNSMANHIYGAVWDGSADTSWTRTDDAASFADPQPYYAGMSGTPSSPFDDIMPWAGMVRSTDANAGEVVAIPKFYYKMDYASGTTGLKIQICSEKLDGFSTSPAHLDRGDGSGERDVVYVGRYHCASDYKSKTGVTPKVSTYFATHRSGIAGLGTSVWQWDYSILMTIRLLYLVEFANWDCQTKIGYGCAPDGSTSAVRTMGYTDSMPYHTGTDRTSRTTYGGTQYRNIEGLWDNCADFIDGLIVSNNQMCIYLNPSTFSNTYNSNYYAYTVTLNGSYGGDEYISGYEIATTPGYEWVMWPKTGGGSSSTYICDGYGYNPTVNPKSTRVGAWYTQNLSYGLFCQITRSGMQDSLINTSSRLMILP